MVDAREAVDIASSSLKKLVPTFASLEPHVEEIERSKDNTSWIITFRAENPEPDGKKAGLPNLFFPYVEKIVLVTKDSGELVAIRNRTYE